MSVREYRISENCVQTCSRMLSLLLLFHAGERKEERKGEEEEEEGDKGVRIVETGS